MEDRSATPGRRIRQAVAVVAAVLAGLLATVTIVAGWARTQVTDTDAFVATFGQLSADTEVRQVLATQVSRSLLQQVPLADTSALVQRTVRSTVETVLASDTFDQLWRRALRTAHTEFSAQLTGGIGWLTLSGGDLELPLEPFVQAARERLVTAGVPLARLIPDTDASVRLASIDPTTVEQARSAYGWLDMVASAGGWVAAALAALAVGIAPRRRRGLIVLGGSAVGWPTILVATWAALTPILQSRLPSDQATVAAAVLDAAGPSLLSPLLFLAVCGLVVVLVAALSPAAPVAAGDVAPLTR